MSQARGGRAGRARQSQSRERVATRSDIDTMMPSRNDRSTTGSINSRYVAETGWSRMGSAAPSCPQVPRVSTTWAARSPTAIRLRSRLDHGSDVTILEDGAGAARCPMYGSAHHDPGRASRRSAQCAYASTSSRMARRSAASLGEIVACVLMSGASFVGEDSRMARGSRAVVPEDQCSRCSWPDARHRLGVTPSHAWKARENEFSSSKPRMNAISLAARSVSAMRRRAVSRRTSSRSFW